MDFELQLRPFKLAVTHKGGNRPEPRWYAPFAMPDSLYRSAARRVITKLIDENRELRRHYLRPPSKTAVLLVWILEHALKKTNWRRSA